MISMRLCTVLLLVGCWPDAALAQGSPCTATAHVENLDPSSFRSPAAERDALSELKVWFATSAYPYSVDRNAAVLAVAAPDFYAKVEVWAEAANLPEQPFAAHDKHGPVQVATAEINRGTRRIVFLVEEDEGVAVAARQVEVAALKAVLSSARPEDSFAVLGVGSQGGALRFRPSRDVFGAVEDLSAHQAVAPNGIGVLKALMQGGGWFGQRRSGDSVFLVSRSLGTKSPMVRRVRSTLASSGIRLFILGLGSLMYAVQDGFVESPLVELCEDSGGGWEQIEGLPRKGDATDAQIELARKEALELYGMIKTFYVVRLERTGPHVMIEPSLQVIDQMPWARVIYPRPLPVCPPPAGTAPAEGNKKK